MTAAEQRDFELFFAQHVQPRLDELKLRTAADLSRFAPSDPYASLRPAKDPAMVARLAVLAADYDVEPPAARPLRALSADELKVYEPPDPYRSLEERR